MVPPLHKTNSQTHVFASQTWSQTFIDFGRNFRRSSGKYYIHMRKIYSVFRICHQGPPLQHGSFSRQPTHISPFSGNTYHLPVNMLPSRGIHNHVIPTLQLLGSSSTAFFFVCVCVWVDSFLTVFSAQLTWHMFPALMMTYISGGDLITLSLPSLHPDP